MCRLLSIVYFSMDYADPLYRSAALQNRPAGADLKTYYNISILSVKRRMGLAVEKIMLTQCPSL